MLPRAAPSLATASLAPARTPAESCGFSTWEGEFTRETGSHLTLRWREMASNHRFPNGERTRTLCGASRLRNLGPLSSRAISQRLRRLVSFEGGTGMEE